jgi:hypothetical protein
MSLSIYNRCVCQRILCEEDATEAPETFNWYRRGLIAPEEE